MEELIYAFFNKNYKFKLSTYSSYKLYDNIDKADVGLKSVLKDTMLVFGISQEELTPIFEKWVDEKSTIINNRIVELQFLMYEKTGQGDTYVTIDDLNNQIGDF
jgi:hypothetical protein